MSARRVWAFVQLTRPVFLLGGALLYGLGLAVAGWQAVALDMPRAVLGQLLVTAIQLTAQYSNEYFDVDGDRLNAANRTFFSGGSGVLPAGRLPASVALTAARACAAVAVVLIAVSALVEPQAAAIGVLALAGSWFYSAPPLALMGNGWGEITTSLLVSTLTPLVGYALQTGRLDPALLIVGLPLALIHWAMLIAFGLPDFDADAAVGKRTQTVRLGRGRAALLHTLLLAAALAVIVGLALTWPPARLLVWAAPLAGWQMASVLWRARAGWQGLGPLTFGAVSLFVSTGLLWTAGFIAS
jgi:1,4-dihydroxy-2-naphthoate octaprenyltransferase